MKAKIIFVLFVMCMLLTGCNFKSNDILEYKGDTITTGSIKIKEGTLTSSSATVIISDTNHDNQYSMEFWIYKKSLDKWRLLDRIQDNTEWETRLYFVDDNGNLELNQNWQDIYGILDRGEYKLVKPITGNKKETKFLSVDFIID